MKLYSSWFLLLASTSILSCVRAEVSSEPRKYVLRVQGARSPTLQVVPWLADGTELRVTSLGPSEFEVVVPAMRGGHWSLLGLARWKNSDPRQYKVIRLIIPPAVPVDLSVSELDSLEKDAHGRIVLVAP